MEKNEIIQVEQAEIMQAINRAEIDQQVATGLKLVAPQDGEVTLGDARLLGWYTDTAFMHRNGANGSAQTIEGLSVRMAEIIAGAWGNLRVATRIIGNDGKTITAQAVCHDLETNVAISTEVKRSILTSKGYTFSQDMQVVTGNAAAAIAFRNAVLKVIPKAVTKRVIEEVKKVAMGQALDLEQQRQVLIQYFAKLNVSEQMILDLLQITKREEIDKERVFTLKGIYNAIKEGDTTVQEAFVKPVEERKLAEQAKQAAEEKKAKAAAAIKKQKEEKTKPAD